MRRAILAALICALNVPASAQDAKPADPVPLTLTTRQDHELMMEALGGLPHEPWALGVEVV